MPLPPARTALGRVKQAGPLATPSAVARAIHEYLSSAQPSSLPTGLKASTDPFLQVGHRAEHVTKDNLCVGFGKNPVLLLPRKADEGTQNYRNRLCAHTQQCVRDSVIASKGPQIQTRQMASLAAVTRGPLSGNLLRSPPTINRVDGWCSKRKSTAPCEECSKSPTASDEAKRPLPSPQAARDHLCEFHDLPVGDSAKNLSAIFFTDRQTYIVDPVEQITECRRLVQERVDVDGSVPYGLRSDMVIDGKTADELAAQPRGADQKYRQVVGPDGVTARDGICMLCAADHTASWRRRGAPFNDTPVSLSTHETNCWQRHVTDRSPLIYGEKRYKCPDVVCKTHKITFGSARELLNHAVLTHMVHFNRTWLSTARVSSAADHTFATDADVEAFIDLRQDRQKYNQAIKRKLKEANRSGSTEESTEAKGSSSKRQSR